MGILSVMSVPLMRLVGATLRQISALSVVESTVAAAAGVVVGFGLFFALRDPMAAIPFTGAPFYPSDLSLTVPDILIVVIGVPAWRSPRPGSARRPPAS